MSDGNTMVSMKDLVQICTDMGFEDVRTYLNSGNVILKCCLPEKKIQESLESVLSEKLGRNISIIIRNADELEEIIKNNPFPGAKGSQVGVMLENDFVENVRLSEFETKGREQVIIGKREVYVYYPDGIGRSTLKWPRIFKNGTMRNINTLTKILSIIGDKPYQQ